MIRLAILLIQLTGPDGSELDINPATIVSLRAVVEDKDTFHGNVKCVVRTIDGNSVGVEETCMRVHELIFHAKEWLATP